MPPAFAQTLSMFALGCDHPSTWRAVGADRVLQGGAVAAAKNL